MSSRPTLRSADDSSRHWAMLVGFAVAAFASSLFGCGQREERASGAPSAVPAPSQGAMQAHIDPETGELTDKPAEGTAPLPGDVRIPPGPHEQKPIPGGGGGMMIDLHDKQDR